MMMLLVSAPAQAFVLGLDLEDIIVNKGDIVDFEASIKVEPDDTVNISSIVLKLDGPLDINCKFKTDGDIISECKGIQIKKISSSDDCYGYDGYCYGYDGGYAPEDEKNFMYKISINTSLYFAGKYKTSLAIYSGNKLIGQKKQGSIQINAKVSLKDCSIRAKKGDSIIEGESFGDNNKINFYISRRGSKTGQGYITGQYGRTTFSYKFSVKNILEDDANHTDIEVSGKYRVDLKGDKTEKSVIVLDKKNHKLTVVGENVNIEYMDVNFKEGC